MALKPIQTVLTCQQKGSNYMGGKREVRYLRSYILVFDLIH